MRIWLTLNKFSIVPLPTANVADILYNVEDNFSDVGQNNSIRMIIHQLTLSLHKTRL